MARALPWLVCMRLLSELVPAVVLFSVACTYHKTVYTTPGRFIDQRATVKVDDGRIVKARAGRTPQGVVWQTDDGEQIPERRLEYIEEYSHGDGVMAGV